MSDVVLEIVPLGFPWVTADPFLFCVHHDDAYPKGNPDMSPAASLAGRNIGMDFEGKDGWRMYHGDTVPGFPQHPHRGFETVTIVRRGYIDHSDSLGATARFGGGDVQWLTAGAGIVHSEMFPLTKTDEPNPVELFQIWLNLPRKNKMVEPHFAMLWNKDIPRVTHEDASGKTTEVTVIAGTLEGKVPPPPPPKSWATEPDADLAIWCIRMDAGATWTMPRAALETTGRTLYVFAGPHVKVGGTVVPKGNAAAIVADVDVVLEAGDGPCELLLLQGKPIDEPVVQHGPFVMNSREEIERAMLDYRRTRFGGWPWPKDGPVHPREETRFAKHIGGRLERP